MGCIVIDFGVVFRAELTDDFMLALEIRAQQLEVVKTEVIVNSGGMLLQSDQ